MEKPILSATLLRIEPYAFTLPIYGPDSGKPKLVHFPLAPWRVTT